MDPAGDEGGGEFEGCEADDPDLEYKQTLIFGTKAVAVSSNKPLTSKFRGERPVAPAQRLGDPGLAWGRVPNASYAR